MKKKLLLHICIAFAVFLGCSSAGSELRVALNGNPDTLDPQKTSATISSQINSNIYESLFHSDGSPQLLENWSIDRGGLQWTVQVREGIYFHHGKELNAEDIIATFERIADKTSNSPFAQQYALIASMQKKDNYTVILRLTDAHAGFKALLSSPESVILPADLIAEEHNFSLHPTGTGPFVFENWKQNYSITMKRNPKHRAPPKIDSLTFIIIRDSSSQVQALIHGELDILPYLGQTDRAQIEKKEHLKVLAKEGSTILLLALNTRHPFLSSVETRKNIAKSIDKKRILDIAYDGGRELNVFWHSNNPNFKELPSEHDQDAAKKYFRQLPTAEPLVLTVPTNYPPHVLAAEMYQEMLRKVGLDVKINQVDWGTWLNQVYRGSNFDLTVIGHTGKLDPDQRLSNFGKGKSYVGWENEEFSSIVKAARTIENEMQRAEQYRLALEIMTKEYPMVFVGENIVKFGVNKRVSDFTFDKVLELYDFRSTRLRSD